MYRTLYIEPFLCIIISFSIYEFDSQFLFCVIPFIFQGFNNLQTLYLSRLRGFIIYKNFLIFSKKRLAFLIFIVYNVINNDYSLSNEINRESVK